MKYSYCSFAKRSLCALLFTGALLFGSALSCHSRLSAEEALTPGTFTGKTDKALVCWDDFRQLKEVASIELSQNGCGKHHYMVVRYGYNESNQPIALDTLGKTSNEQELLAWYNNYWIPGDSVGDFAIRMLVHDDGCTTEWQPCNGEVRYRVLSALNPGKIALPIYGRDTVYLKNGKYKVSVGSLEPASGASGKYAYEWLRGVKKIGFDEELKDYTITAPGYVRLRRNVKDSADCGVAISEGVYQLKVYDELLPGAIDEREDLVYCTPAKAAEDIISATPASGGSLTYLYQWFIKSGDELTPIEGATQCNLPLSKVNLVAGKDYTFVRKVKDNTRFSEWTLTENQQTLRMEEKPEVRILEKDHMEACACNGEITLYYELVKGDVDMYAIEFSDNLAAAIGKPGLLAYISEPRIQGTIVIPNIPSLPDGDYYMDVRLGISCAAKSLEQVDCYSSTTRVKVVNGLDGYVRSKFNRVLCVDNNPDESNSLSFSKYQWYKNGQPVAGATEQYYQEGEELDGSYYVRLTDANGKSYRSCSVHMFDTETAIDALSTDGLVVYPVPVEAGGLTTVRSGKAEMTIYSCTGEQVMTLTTANELTTFKAPAQSGVYYIQLRHDNGSTQTGKLIVK